jgi:hypothetical protein
MGSNPALTVKQPVVLNVIGRVGRCIGSGLKVSFLWVPRHVEFSSKSTAYTVVKAAFIQTAANSAVRVPIYARQDQNQPSNLISRRQFAVDF